MVFKLLSGHYFVTETATYKNQRGITQKINIQKLWFLRSAHRLMLVSISMTFHEDILNRFQVTERTRFCDGQADRRTDRGTNDHSKNNTSPDPGVGRHKTKPPNTNTCLYN